MHRGAEEFHISSEVFVFFRFALGFAVFSLVLIVRRQSPLTGDLRFLIFRSIFNVAAVLTFFHAVAEGDTGRANVLNMTYPAFVTLFAGRILGEYPDRRTIILVAVSVAGILMQFHGPYTGQGITYFWGLASGILAAAAVISLRGAALTAGSPAILFWMFGIGLPLLLPLAWKELSYYSSSVLFYIMGSAVCGVAGQWLLTESYRSMSATAGSIVSSSRIPIALLIGLFFLAEPFSALSWMGAFLIFICNLLLAVQKNK